VLVPEDDKPPVLEALVAPIKPSTARFPNVKVAPAFTSVELGSVDLPLSP